MYRHPLYLTKKFVANWDMKLTDSEIGILHVLWKEKNCTVRQVNSQMNQVSDTEIGYTTTLKMMQLMLDKGIIKKSIINKIHIFSPNISIESVSDTIISKLIKKFFYGSSSQFIIQALNNHEASDEEIAAIKNYLETKKI